MKLFYLISDQMTDLAWVFSSKVIELIRELKK